MKRKSQPVASYLKYTGLAFQMFFLLLAGWFIGSYADGYFGFEKPYLGLTLTTVFLLGFFYKLYKEMDQGKL